MKTGRCRRSSVYVRRLYGLTVTKLNLPHNESGNENVRQSGLYPDRRLSCYGEVERRPQLACYLLLSPLLESCGSVVSVMYSSYAIHCRQNRWEAQIVV